MIKYIWRVSAAVNTQLRHLPPDLKQRVRSALDIIHSNPEMGKPLSEELAGYRSYRLGKYRMIYRIKGDRLILEALGPRSSIYERFVLEFGRLKIRERQSSLYRLRQRKALRPKATLGRKPSVRPRKRA
ncbi:MAG: type II toxin-antitoxin system RelE/ParE family toxin [Candidatus Omnitrophica bacterium]|nr:type II toxin-antitoxin system RelE/ParE family toxin [Candidatus Omnitrophota bacterium]